MQITAGSLTGIFGPAPQQHAWTWLDRGMVHFVSSDAHNTGTASSEIEICL